jgi:endoglucanase
MRFIRPSNLPDTGKWWRVRGAVVIPGTGGGGAGGGVTKKYTVNATADVGGSIDPGGTLSVDEGSSRTFNITAATDYVIDDVTVDGVSIGAASSYTLTSASKDTTIRAKFKKPNPNTIYTITASAGTGGTISPSGATSVTNGNSQTYTITPSSGFSIQSVTVDGSTVGSPSTYTFSNVTGNHTISAAFTQTQVATYTVTATAGTGGTISPSGVNTVNVGTASTYTITPSAGFSISNVVADGINMGVVSTYTFPSSSTNTHTISATFSSDYLHYYSKCWQWWNNFSSVGATSVLLHQVEVRPTLLPQMLVFKLIQFWLIAYQ